MGKHERDYFKPSGVFRLVSVLPLMRTVPFGSDALVIVLAAKYRELFWLFPPLMAIGSLVAAALTYWIGRSAGHIALPRLVSPRHLERIKVRLAKADVGSVAAAAVLPPPFPLTPFILTYGALDLDRGRFFLVFGVMRLVRFGAEAVLARHYGEHVLNALQAASVPRSVIAIVLAAILATTAAVALRWRRTRLLARA